MTPSSPSADGASRPFAHAEILTQAFLSFLRTGHIRKSRTIGPAYVKGESFP